MIRDKSNDKLRILKRTEERGVQFSLQIAVAAVIIILLILYRSVLGVHSDYWKFFIPVIGIGLSVMDSAIGMGYGTIGTPLLIVLGFSSKAVVPAVLISQGVAAIIASTYRQSFKNVNYFSLKGKDVGVELLLVIFGLAGATAALFISLHLSKSELNTYIGILVISMSIFLLLKPKLTFSWTRITVLSIVSGFNKAISGGGYGPLATTGLLLSGNPLRNTVGVTIFSVMFINLYSFVIYAYIHSFVPLELSIFLTVGALIGSQIGPNNTKKATSDRARAAFALAALVMGALTILLTFEE